MFMFLLLLFILVIFLWYIWGQRKTISIFLKLKNDVSLFTIITHTCFGTNEDRMTAFQLLGREAIKQGGITRVWAVLTTFFFVADARIAEAVLTSSLEKVDVLNTLKNLIGNGSLFASVPIWRPRRKVLIPGFAPKHINNFLKYFDKNSRIMATQLDVQAGQGSFSVWKYLTAYAMDSVCETTLDIHINALHTPDQPFLLAFEEYCQMSGKRLCEPWYYNETVYYIMNGKMKEHIKTMHDYIDQIIKKKRATLAIEQGNKSNDNDKDGHRDTLLDLLLNATFNSEGYTDLELREELLIIILAGSDTSAAGSAFTLLILAMYPDIQEKVYEELHDIFGSSLRSVTPEDLTKMKYLNAVIKETLRLYPPVPLIGRKTQRDIILPTGLILPNNTDIIIHIWAINRNPLYWGENAEEFDPTRFLDKPLSHPAALTSFSYGPRNCIGYQYAYVSMKTVISTLLRRFRILPARESNGTTPLRVKYGIMLKDNDDFCIKLEKRSMKS